MKMLTCPMLVNYNVDVLLERKAACYPFTSFRTNVYVLVSVFVLAFVFVLYLYLYLYWAGSSRVGGVWPVGHWLPPNVSILTTLTFHYHYQIQTNTNTNTQKMSNAKRHILKSKKQM